jgi:hypothetical protein
MNQTVIYFTSILLVSVVGIVIYLQFAFGRFKAEIRSIKKRMTYQNDDFKNTYRMVMDTTKGFNILKEEIRMRDDNITEMKNEKKMSDKDKLIRLANDIDNLTMPDLKRPAAIDILHHAKGLLIDAKQYLQTEVNEKL